LKTGSGREEEEVEEDEAILVAESGNLTDVGFGGESIQSVIKILGPAHCDRKEDSELSCSVDRGFE
jgi:hypothetical protein